MITAYYHLIGTHVDFLPKRRLLHTASPRLSLQLEMIMARTQLLSRQAPCHPSSSTSMSPTLIAHPPHGQEAYHGYQPHPTTTTTHSWQYDGWRCGRIVVRSLRAAATTRHSLPTVLSVCDPSFLYRHTPSPRERTRSCSFHDNCVGPRKRS